MSHTLQTGSMVEIIGRKFGWTIGIIKKIVFKNFYKLLEKLFITIQKTLS